MIDAMHLASPASLLDKHAKARKPLPDPEAKDFDDCQPKVSDLLGNSSMTM
jgi:hypothetical protein